MSVPFEEFFEAIWLHPPYPWQAELSRQVREEGWPAVLDVPTGCGKTAAMDVALHHFVTDGGRTAPRRILMVVDRRVIVDQVATRATRILEVLASAGPSETEGHGVLSRVRDALRSIVGPYGPLLHTHVMRGGTVRSDAWAKYPHTPVLAGSTIDQIGSRLFFRGYGVSQRMRAVHAGLLGCDTLLLLDEVHLSRPFADVLEQLIQLRQNRRRKDLGRFFDFVQLSATPGSSVANEETGRSRVRLLGITDADRGNERVARILGASKPARLKTVTVRGKDEAIKRNSLAAAVVSEALQMVSGGCSAVAIVVNRVATARRAWALLEDRINGFDTALITGRMRPLDQAHTIEQIRDRVTAGRTADASARPIIVVTTQTIEAGADYDFDGLVTEAAPLDSLRQRFGRLDRRGELRRPTSGSESARGETKARSSPAGNVEHSATRTDASSRGASAVIVARNDQLKNDDLVYGNRLRRTWHWLETVAVDGVVDFGIDALQVHLDVLGEKINDLVTFAQDAPVLLPAYLDQWVQTSPAPHADPDVALFLHGIPQDAQSALQDVQVVWRSDVTEWDLAVSGRKHLRDRLIERVATVPPGSLEAISLPIQAVRRWLANDPIPADDDIADVEGAPADTIDGSRRFRPVLIWRGASRSDVVSANDIKPGDLIIVPESYGGLGVHRTFDPDAPSPEHATSSNESPIYDLGDAVQLLQRGSPTLRLDARVIGRIVGTSFEAKLPDPDDEAVDRQAALSDALTDVREMVDRGPVWFRDILQALLRPRFDRLPGGGWIAIGRKADQSAGVSLDPVGGGEADDESFLANSRPDLLETHLREVSQLASEFADSAQMSPSIIASIRWAGRLHDIGKLDPRFQVLLHGGDEISARFGDKLAKSAIGWQSKAARRAARERAGYADGQRHELVSLALIEHSAALRERVEVDGADWDLVLHLVASHHAWCRPWLPVAAVSHDASDLVSFDCDGVELTASTAHGYDRLGSGVTDRFWRLVHAYGWHELAYLEAILQLADHRQSAGDARPRTTSEAVTLEAGR